MSSNPTSDFRLLTNHGNALLLIARDPRARLRDIAAALVITERQAQRIVGELVTAGYLTREREGRRNSYQVASHLPGSPLFSQHSSMAEYGSELSPKNGSRSGQGPECLNLPSALLDAP